MTTPSTPARATGGRPVALAIRNADMQAGRIFDLTPDGPVDQAPYTPWRLVRDAAATAGFDLITADQVEARGVDPRQVWVLSYDWPPATDALLARGARLGLLTTLEPPVIAWELYYRLPAVSARFPHVLLFGGAVPRVAPGTAFHRLHFPQVRVPRPAASAREGRRLLVSIASNKGVVRSLGRWFDRPREVSLRRLVAARRYPAIPPRLHAAAARTWRGPSPEKLATLARYRFALCFENSRFAGYVSEKLFDCLFSGCVPVYLGAPDVERFVPREAFVDARQFRDYADLVRFLEGLSPAAEAGYREAADAFLRSPAYVPFTQDWFARQVVDILRSLPA